MTTKQKTKKITLSVTMERPEHAALVKNARRDGKLTANFVRCELRKAGVLEVKK